MIDFILKRNLQSVNSLPESQAAIAVASCQIALQLDRIATLLEHQA